MNQSNIGNLPAANRPVNAVALQSAVLCAECDVVSDSPHDICLVCGSRSLFNISAVFGGNLPGTRARLVQPSLAEVEKPELVLAFSRTHQARRKVSA